MLRRALWMLDRLADLIWPRPVAARRGGGIDMPDVECFVAESNSPLKREENRAQLTEDAMKLTDDDTYGYLVMILKKDSPAGHSGHVEVSGYVQDSWAPAFHEVCQRAALSVATPTRA